MRLIVADTTPLNYLILIEAVEVLPRLYGNILIPGAVRDELSHPKASDAVRQWIGRHPSWLSVADLRAKVPSTLLHFDAGEREAICLAAERQADLLLMDDRDEIAAALDLGLNVVGTLAVLDQAAVRGWINLKITFDRLLQTSFRCPRRLMATMLEADAKRKARS